MLIASKTDLTTTLSAAEFNQLPTELATNLITSAGLTPSAGTLDQVAKAVAAYAAQGGVFCTDSGAADAYVLTQIGSMVAPPALRDGLRIIFRADNANTGATTINAFGTGAIAAKKKDASTALPANTIKTTQDSEFRYEAASGFWIECDYNPMTTRGDIITGAAGGVPQRLALGTSGYAVKSNGTDVLWGPVAAIASFTSSNQTISTSGTLTIAHGLGDIPTFIRAYIVCTSTDAGYSVNDVVEYYFATSISANDSYGAAVSLDATNIVVRWGGNSALINLPNKGTRTGTSLDNTKWALVVKAFLIS